MRGRKRRRRWTRHLDQYSQGSGDAVVNLIINELIGDKRVAPKRNSEVEGLNSLSLVNKEVVGRVEEHSTHEDRGCIAFEAGT